MIRALKWISTLVTQNLGWKLLALAIAVGIWAMVASEPEMETSISVPLEYENMPENIEISSVSPSSNSVLLELRGPSGELRSLGEGALRPGVVLNMAGVKPGQQTFMIGNGDVRLPHGVHLMWARPSVVRFDFETRLSRKVPVSVRFSGEGRNGYAVANYSVSPERLEIVGPSDDVSRVRAVTTDPIDVSEVIGTATLRVNVFVSDPYVRFQSTPQVTVTVTMKKKS